MKKYISFILLLIFLISLLSCGILETEAPLETEDLFDVGGLNLPRDATPEPNKSNLELTAKTAVETTLESTTVAMVKTAVTEAVATTEEDAVAIIPEHSQFEIRFIDVGQADAALVECDGHYMLIDGGNKADSSKIYSILQSAKVEKLDIVVGTHAHEDHIGGLSSAFNYTTVDLTLCPVTAYDTDAFENFAKYANEKGGGIVVPSVGDTYFLGSATVSILGVNSTSDTNNSSIILKVEYGETSFLFTGDAEREAEQAVLNSGADLSATVLKVGHHGSADSTSYRFLREVMPVYAIISVGKDNVYGHPTDEALSRLRDADVKVYRTDLQGDIICYSDGITVTVSVERNPDTATVITTEKAMVPAITEKFEVSAAPSQHSYVLNTNTKKFHSPDCSSVKQMKDKNKSFFTGTREEVIAMGYAPCGRCNP